MALSAHAGNTVTCEASLQGKNSTDSKIHRTFEIDKSKGFNDLQLAGYQFSVELTGITPDLEPSGINLVITGPNGERSSTETTASQIAAALSLTLGEKFADLLCWLR